MPFLRSLRSFAGSLLHSLGDRVGGIDLQAERENEKLAMGALAKITRTADVKMAMNQAELERRVSMGLLDYKVPLEWQSLYYLRQGFRVKRSIESAPSDHWQGGPPQHEGAVCPICNKPLVLFWDIHVKDPNIQQDGVQLFQGLDRLPLYYCPRRPDSTVYRIEARGRIRTITPELRAYEESPFQAFPDFLPREPLRLDPLPREVANLLILANDFDVKWLSKEELAVISQFADRDVSFSYQLGFDQFGGVPTISQEHQKLDCPNPACQTRQMGNPYFSRPRAYCMKELAVINDPAGNAGTQIVFHICWKCLTIQGDYVSD